MRSPNSCWRIDDFCVLAVMQSCSMISSRPSILQASKHPETMQLPFHVVSSQAVELLDTHVQQFHSHHIIAPGIRVCSGISCKDACASAGNSISVGMPVTKALVLLLAPGRTRSAQHDTDIYGVEFNGLLWGRGPRPLREVRRRFAGLARADSDVKGVQLPQTRGGPRMS